ncbi:MAG TPA: hypothetical protein VHK44_03910 [Xanthobacteraceae bacterium]|nr:hypothetical protein [Xanthobacteraceae bacterium]
MTDIKAMRSQMARGTEFRGYGPVAFVATGLLAIGAALAQAHWIDDPSNQATAYLGLWIATAMIAGVIIGVDVVTRSRRVHSGLADEMIQAAAEQLFPAVVAGGLVTVVLFHFSPESLRLLPGLWQIILSLGIFASCRSLPAPFIIVGVWYLAAGLVCLAFANNGNEFSPWAMGVPFGIGQFLAAVLIQNIGTDDAED